MAAAAASAAAACVWCCKFEVFGRVQGVFFRKFTKQKADALNITGHIRNTIHGSVRGEAEAPSARALAAFKEWLEKEGSPRSKPEYAEFRDEGKRAARKFDAFEIRR